MSGSEQREVDVIKKELRSEFLKYVLISVIAFVIQGYSFKVGTEKDLEYMKADIKEIKEDFKEIKKIIINF